MDIIKPFMLEDKLFKGALISADNTLDALIKTHAHYPDKVKTVLAETTLVALFLSSSIKYDGVFTLQLKGDGPVSSLVVEVTNTHSVRAFAVFDAQKMPTDDTLPALFGNGQLLFSVRMIGHEPYQGVVELKETLIETVADYLNRSEQIPSAFVLRHQGFRYKGIFVQQLPKPTDLSAEEMADKWETIQMLLHSVRENELFSELAPDEILFRLFHANKLMVFPEQPVSFFCACHRDTFLKFLKRLNHEELTSLAQNGIITAECEFCHKKYQFNVGDLS